MTDRPTGIVIRNATVLTMDADHRVLTDTDVLVVGDAINQVGASLQAPPGTQEIDGTGGLVMPGMIDTHRHLWQTAMRGYGADWTLTQYFVWYYLEHGRKFRPEDIYAGNLLGAIEAVDAGVTTTVDWSHGLQSVEHAAAAVEALEEVPARFVLAYGNIQAAPWEWTAQPEVRRFLEQRKAAISARMGVQLAFDVLGDPAFPEQAAFEVARDLELPVTTHAGVWGATNDAGIRLMHDNGFATPETVYVHAATLDADSYLRIAASGGSISVSTESEQSAGQGYPPTWQVRKFDIPVSLSMDTSVWWSGDLFSAMRSTLGADRAREHLEAHVAGDTVTSAHLRAEHVVDWATRGGARALRRDDIGSLELGKKADLVLIKNDRSPVSFPLLNPYGHVAFQAQRGDVHSVIIDGRLVKHEHELVGIDLAKARAAVESTVEYLRASLGEEVWQAGMHPDLPADDDDKVLDNPYTYTDYRSSDTREARESIFGESAGDDLSRPDLRCEDGLMARRSSEPDFVEALARGLDILSCFDERHRRMSLSEVAVATGLARPTARRLLLTLAELGYVRLDGGSFALTPKVLSLGVAYASSLGLWEIARPHLEALVAQTHESSSMAQLDGSDIVYVARVSVPKIIALRVDIGTRFPAERTSQGKILLAALTEQELTDTLAEPSRAGLAPAPPRDGADLRRELMRVRAQGWSLADEELARGIRSIAAPVRDGAGAVRAAMNVTVHAAETSTAQLLGEYLPLLLETAGRISGDWALAEARPHRQMDQP